MSASMPSMSSHASRADRRMVSDLPVSSDRPARSDLAARQRIRDQSAATLTALALALALAGCATDDSGPRQPTAEQTRARIERLLPPKTPDADGWAADIQTTFSLLGLSPSVELLCSAIAVIAQESSFRTDPTVPNLGSIARKEIDARADRIGIPSFAVNAALSMRSPDGRTYGERIDAARSERELSETFEALIGSVPLGQRMLGGFNPVRTGGPMQVSIAWSEAYAGRRPYPYADAGSIRREVFTRRGGLYFGIAHLLDYPASYDRSIYRFADFNAGHYASRNAAFQNAVAMVSGEAVTLDGDLVIEGGSASSPGETERAVRAIAPRLGAPSDTTIRRALESGNQQAFEQTPLYRDVFALADRKAGKPLPRAMLPRIQLKSPKITRNLTTAWFAERVDTRRQQCVAREAPATATPAR